MEEILKNFFVFQLPAEVFLSLIIILVLIVLSLIFYFVAKNVDPLQKPKGIVAIMEIVVSKVDDLVDDNMGEGFSRYSPYVLTIAIFLGICFIVGITGLPNPLMYLGVPLSLALCTFSAIHFTSMKYTKWGYFRRYIDPIPVFLPVNLIGMWAPLLSLTLRLFGNVFASWVLMTIVYWALGSLSSAIFAALPSGVNSIFIAPLITPVLHAYFDLFSGAIQILVFMFLSMLFIAQEKPEDFKVNEELALKTNKVHL